MTKPVYAIIPLRLETWKMGEFVSADCLNDLHSSNNELCQVFGEDDFRAYNDNSFHFKTTRDPDYQLPQNEQVEFSGHVLLEVSIFSQDGYYSRSSPGHVEIFNVTAQKLMQLFAVIHQHVS